MSMSTIMYKYKVHVVCMTQMMCRHVYVCALQSLSKGQSFKDHVNDSVEYPVRVIHKVSFHIPCYMYIKVPH